MQRVDSPTHAAGNILDLVFSSLDLDCLNIKDQSSIISDHFLLTFRLSSPSQPNTPRNSLTDLKLSRDLASIDISLLTSEISNFPSHNFSDPDILSSSFHNFLVSLMDSHAPLISRPRPTHICTLWYNRSLCTLKRKRRQLERRVTTARHRGEGLEEVSSMYRSVTSLYFRELTQARENHSMESVSDSRSLFSLIGKLSKPKIALQSALSCESFSDFFINKIVKVRSEIPLDSCPVPSVHIPCFLSEFVCPTEDVMREIISSSHKFFSPNDPFPSSLTAQCASAIIPHLRHLF